MKQILLILLISFGALEALCQTIPNPVVTPPSPQSEAIKRYGEYSVNHFTGVPDISIPLYEINHRGYKLPISLRYYPHALKAGYNYDVFGLGWGLSINSCVSRTIETKPDEETNFKLDTEKLEDYFTDHKPEDLLLYNWAYDKFNVTLPNGDSYEFVIKMIEGNLTYFISDNRAIKITCNYSPSKISSFEIVDENGVKYTFNEADSPYFTGSTFNNFFVSWNLTQIDLPQVAEPIIFNYDYTIQYNFYGSFTENGVYIKSSWDPNRDDYNLPFKISFIDDIPESVLTAYRMKLLSSVEYGDIEIQMNYANSSIVSDHNYVDKISIEKNSNIVREIDLNMTTQNLRIPGSPANGYPIAKLNTVSIKGENSTELPIIFECTYENMAYSFSGLDHWGYLNTSDTRYNVANLNFFAECKYSFTQNWSGVTNKIDKKPQELCPYDKLRLKNTPGNNRLPAYTYDNGVLKRLTFPTGGYSEFVFENHRFLTSTDDEGDYIHEPLSRIEAKAAGFRIKSITNFDKSGTQTDAKYYMYGQFLDQYKYHTGVGEAVVDPNIINYSNIMSSFGTDDYWLSILLIRDMLIGLNVYDPDSNIAYPFINFNPYQYWVWDCHFSATNFRRLVNGRTPVIYPEVTVYQGYPYDQYGSFSPQQTSGKTVYKYNECIEPLVYYQNHKSYESRKCRYNKLKERTEYISTNSGFERKKKEVYDWTDTENYITDYVFSNRKSDLYSQRTTYVSDVMHPKFYYIGSSLLSSKTTTFYSSTGDSVISHEGFIYSSRDQLTAKYEQTSNGGWKIQSYIYPQSSSADPILQQMVAKNIIAPIVETTMTQGSATEKITTSYFNPSGNIYVPQSVQQTIGTTTTTKLTYNSYDDKGNVTQYTGPDGVVTTILWGYNKTYPVAKVVSGSPFTISENIRTNINNRAYCGTDVKSEVDGDIDFLSQQLSDYIGNNSYQVALYTYKLLVGMTSETNANGNTSSGASGITNYYTYDSFGRLSEVRDDEGKLLKKNSYNYANQ